ncbi:tyrosine-type recombinase/integrase [Methylobacterium sp. J-077]|uniref:tyrosine-type recombinase/integrase n=1 Tax=Methylobacterium sp. J-077 TaxID=2836656 RepID=UPI001FB8D1E4|nr:tyrosine-type recombinase/integrase [Methylobacterium sp. J-077]MCJ2121772.1 site-specific integrase [Methylobacterium sp. J-077]
MPRRRNGDGLYKRPDGTYHYDVGKGVDRITIATGKHDRRAARDVVKDELAQRKFAMARSLDRNAVQTAPMSGKTYLLGEVLEQWIQKHRTTNRNDRNFRNNSRSARQLVDELGADKPICMIRAHDLRKIANRYRDEKTSPTGRKLKEATINRRVLDPMRGMYNLALKELQVKNLPYIVWSTIGRRPHNERARYLRAHEMEALVKEAPDKDALVHEFMWLTGIRVGAVVNLRWSDIDERLGVISIRNKGGAIHGIPLTPETRQIIGLVRGDHPEFVFTYRNNRLRKRTPLTYCTFFKRARKTFNCAGLVDYVLHDHRHTAACLIFVASNFNMYAVKELLGHKDISSCERYVHLDKERLRQDLMKISSWAPSIVGCETKMSLFFSDGPPALSIAFLRANDNLPASRR